MASRKISGNAAVDSILGALETKFGKTIAHKGPKYEAAVPITTGSSSLDAALWIGGIPKGRIIEIFGPESSGKTSLALRVMVNYIKQFKDKRPCVIIDMERSIMPSLITSMGGVAEDIVFCYPDSAEEALETWRRLNGSGQIGFCIIDSIDALQSENTLKKDIGESDMAGIAKMVGTAIREVAKTSIEHDITNILINQERDGMDPYGPKKVTPGGKAIRYYCSTRIQMMTQKPSPTVEDAFLMRPKVVKNKCGPPHPEDVEIDFVYGIGPDPYTDLIAFTKQVGAVQFRGTSVVFNSPNGEEKLDCKATAGFLTLIKSDQKLFDKIQQRAFVLFRRKSAPEVKVEVEADAPPSDEELESEVVDGA